MMMNNQSVCTTLEACVQNCIVKKNKKTKQNTKLKQIVLNLNVWLVFLKLKFLPLGEYFGFDHFR